MKFNTIFTCEHAGNDIPEDLKDIFQNQEEIINSHRGWDPGAWNIAWFLATSLNAPLFGTFTSRLVLEANRSLNHSQLFSEFTGSLSKKEKDALLHQYYFPYRNKVEAVIQHSDKPVLHLSMHSFTPVWKESVRHVDIGLLFDPSRKNEQEFCVMLHDILQKQSPELVIRSNEPYQGIDDGFTSYLRTKFRDPDYLGIEIEINQKFNEPVQLEMIGRKILTGLRKV